MNQLDFTCRFNIWFSVFWLTSKIKWFALHNVVALKNYISLIIHEESYIELLKESVLETELVKTCDHIWPRVNFWIDLVVCNPLRDWQEKGEGVTLQIDQRDSKIKSLSVFWTLKERFSYFRKQRLNSHGT